MYKARYINPLRQFGNLSLELILEDETGLLPRIREWCKFIDSEIDSDIMIFTESFIKASIASLQEKEETSQEIKDINIELISISEFFIDKENQGTLKVEKI